MLKHSQALYVTGLPHTSLHTLAFHRDVAQGASVTKPCNKMSRPCPGLVVLCLGPWATPPSRV